MSQNRVQEGNTLTISTPVAVVGGQVVVMGDVCGVAETSAPAGALVAVAMTGVYRLPKTAGAVALGKKLYWDADGTPAGGPSGAGCLTTVATDNILAGHATQAAEAGDAHVLCRLVQ